MATKQGPKPTKTFRLKRSISNLRNNAQSNIQAARARVAEAKARQLAKEEQRLEAEERRVEAALIRQKRIAALNRKKASLPKKRSVFDVQSPFGDLQPSLPKTNGGKKSSKKNEGYNPFKF